MSDSSAPADENVPADESTPADGQEPEVFVNRAARRAKGKGGQQTEVFTKGKSPAGGRGSVQSPRQYGNRRSG